MSDSDSNESSPLLNKLSVNKDPKDVRSPKKISRKYLEDVSSSDKQRDPFVVKTPVIARVSSADDLNHIMQFNRYRYYSKLSGAKPSHLKIPDHVLPRELFWPHRGAKGAKQSSFITIFAIWNTMMGTSLLSLPWAIQQSGFALGIAVIIIMGIICLFTCLLIVDSGSVMGDSESVEFIDICEKLLGKIGKYVAFVFGVIAFLGAVLVYWVLMSNFLYKIGRFAHQQTLGDVQSNSTDDSVLHHGVYCHSQNMELNRTSPAPLNPTATDGFYKYWNQQKTVPLFLVCLLLPLSSFKSPTFFTKFNALGTLSVLYIVCFVIVKSIEWGGHLHFQTPDDPSEPITKLYNLGFPSLTGILALALYIHNAILSILATNEKPQNNKRDVSIAYLLTASTYFLVAVLFYSCFPLPKDCVEQVFLDNFPSSDVMTVVAQCGLFFQMTTVFPLLLYILRVQIYGFINGVSVSVGYPKIIALNIVFVACGVLMAMFYPQVGHIIRYVGSLSGLVYIFTLPSLVQMKILSMKSKLTTPRIIFYTGLILLGVLNLAAQFLVTD